MAGGASNRQRGDYLERQTKAALEEQGWFVIRAAGSLGEADLVALRAGSTPLLVACKTNGTMAPAERTALRTVAELAGARALLAHRPSRGVIHLVLVRDPIDREAVVAVFRSTKRRD